MRQWLLRRGFIAVSCIGLVVVWVGFFCQRGSRPLEVEPGRHDQSFGVEPSYKGLTLGYWASHAVGYDGSTPTNNADAVEAIHAMKQEAIPLFVKWISTPSRSSTGIDYGWRALEGFRILRAEADSAIPELIQVMGRNGSRPALALASMGSNAVPALIELLTTNRVPDTYGNRRRKIPENRTREHAILALEYIGTNAQAALPVLMRCYRYEDRLSRADMASALASVGASQPDLVVPALIELLTNRTGFNRIQAVEALASFGSQAQLAVPTLLEATQSEDAQLQIKAALTLKTIAPQTAGVITPLIANLTNRVSYIRGEAVRALKALGTNAMEGRSAMLELVRQESNPAVRAPVMDCLTKLGASEEEMLPVVQECLTNRDESVACAAARGLVSMAWTSQARYRELLWAWEKHPNSEVQSIAVDGVRKIMQKEPNFILECLRDPNRETYSVAMKFLDGISQNALVLVRYEPEPSTNYRYFKMWEMSDGNKKLLLPAIPTLVTRLEDENALVRKLATNILLEIDPKVAKKAGVQVGLPYSVFAE